MGILSWIIFGLIAGALAKWIMPGDQKSGCIVTVILGIVGAIVGGFIGDLIGLGNGKGVNDFSIGSFAIAVVGALIVLAIYGAVTKRR